MKEIKPLSFQFLTFGNLEAGNSASQTIKIPYIASAIREIGSNKISSGVGMSDIFNYTLLSPTKA